jgi:hypothetical protein
MTLRRYDVSARRADLSERALAWIEDRLTQDFPVEIVERFAEVVDAIETEMSESERGLAGRRGRPSRSVKGGSTMTTSYLRGGAGTNLPLRLWTFARRSFRLAPAPAWSAA